MHFLFRGGQGEKRSAINFREGLLPSRSRRPFHLKRVALQRCGIAVALQCPGMHELAGLVLHRSKWNQFRIRFDRQSSFFLKFANRCCPLVLSRIDLALGQKPSAVILPCPKRPPEMHQQKLKHSAPAAIKDEPCADFGGFRHRSARRVEATAYRNLQSQAESGGRNRKEFGVSPRIDSQRGTFQNAVVTLPEATMPNRRMKMNTIRIAAIPTEVANAVRSTLKAPTYGFPAHVEVAGDAAPCRHCLRAFVAGKEQRILFTYDRFAGVESLPQPGPVYI